MLKSMDVVPDSKDFLGEFIAGSESEESERMKVLYPKEVKESDVWVDIEAALQHWMMRANTRRRKSSREKSKLS